MTAMLERAAIAASEAAEAVPSELHGTREGWLIVVSAALMVVRGPGETAVNAYFDKCRDMGFAAHINASCAMETMIDAILNEGLQ